jgi:hypothetical protein
MLVKALLRLSMHARRTTLNSSPSLILRKKRKQKSKVK